MLRVDEFESVFRSAAKEPFRLDLPEVESVLLVTDLDAPDLERYGAAVVELLAGVGLEEAAMRRLGRGSFSGVEELLGAVDEAGPDLLVSYRNLRSDAWRWSWSLGVYLSALVRGTTLPVLITPHPGAHPGLPWRESGLDSVMVVTDHLTGDHRLVSWGVRMTARGGTLCLAHVEQEQVFARYVEAISKIPSIDTDNARETILAQLQKEPRDYVESCRAVLEAAEVDLKVVPEIAAGHRVSDFRSLVEKHDVDLLVFPTLEEDVIALHGVSHQLAVELVDTPILMI